MDRQNWLNGLAKDASEHEDRRTVLTRVVVYLKGVRLVEKKPVTFRTDEGNHACSDDWIRSAPRWRYESLEAKQLTGRLQGANGS